MKNGSTLPYDLRIGVTGHRDAVGVGIDDAVRRAFDRIAVTLADPAVPLSWVVISPLAKGADRAVARIAMDRGARLEAILPLPLDDYRADFDTEDDRREFDALLGRAQPRVEPRAPTSGGSDRTEDYLRAGEEVVDACEILLAIWDGQPASGKGGTAEIVRHAVDVGRMVLWIHSVRPHQAVVRIKTLTADRSGQLRIGKRDFPADAAVLSPGYAQQAAYCNDPSIDEASLREGVRSTTENLEKHAACAGLQVGEWSGPIVPLVREHVRSDLLARHYQRRHILIVKCIIRLAAAAVTVAVAQVVFFPNHPSLIFIEVLSMLAVLYLWRYGRRRKLHQHWLRNRFLAERLRAAIFTTLPHAGVELRSELPLPFYGGPHHWMTRIVSAMSSEAASSIPELSLEPLKHFIAAAWIDEQRAFHAKTGRLKAGEAHRRHTIGFGLFAATLVAALLHFAGIGHHMGPGLSRICRIEYWITALALVFPVWASATHALVAQLELERVSERSKRMVVALAHIRVRILRARTGDELRNRTASATVLMHDEAHEWWVLLSFQDVRLHV